MSLSLLLFITTSVLSIQGTLYFCCRFDKLLPCCDWVLEFVELWQAIRNIIDNVNSFTRHILHSEAYNNILPHCPGPLVTVHQCDWRCHNYFLQSCTDICALISLINVVALEVPLFKHLTSPLTKKLVYLPCPSQNAYCLR